MVTAQPARGRPPLGDIVSSGRFVRTGPVCGYVAYMADTERGLPNFEPADHAMGLELQIVELVEQQERARVQHRPEDVARLEGEIAQLRTELARTAESAHQQRL